MSRVRVRAGEAATRDRDLQRRLPEYDRGFLQRLTSYYLCSYPPDWGRKALWYKFAEFGRVGDVFVPNRRDKRGQKFGFVRFEGVKDVKALEAALDGLRFGDFDIRVRLALNTGHRGYVSGNQKQYGGNQQRNNGERKGIASNED